ncbi:MAG: MFS transporter [Chlamydiales bacterium]|nr:MFS transporter [Chlamydiales bacterium]
MLKARISKHPIAFLNITQFLGALNDNVFKYLIVFLLINILGVGASTDILFWVGVIYVLPFLLFSSNAGILADRFSKQRLIVILKLLEVIIMLCGIVAFAFKNSIGLYTLLFLLSLQSALFSPPKYSIIPELVDRKSISKANGAITSATYLAIIVGTFLASFITQISHENFVLSSTVCLLIAIAGFSTSFFVPYVPPKHTKKKMTPFFIRSIFTTLASCQEVPYLLTSITGAAFFLFVGAFFQLNIIPFAINSLGMDKVGGGYLFLVCAIGIAVGAHLAGKVSHKQVEIGLSCLAGIGMAITIIPLYLFQYNLVGVIILLFAIGFMSGFFIIPFDSFVQTYSHGHHRGQVIAANNFISFCGVLLAPVTIYLVSGFFQQTAAMGFLVIASLIILFNLFLLLRASSLLLNFIARHILLPIWKGRIPMPIKAPAIQVFQLRALVFLWASTPFSRLYMVKPKRPFWGWLFKLVESIEYMDKPNKTLAPGILAIYWRPKKKALMALPTAELYHRKNRMALRISSNSED